MQSMSEINAITLACTNMPRSYAFYQGLGLPLHYGGPDEAFTSFGIGPNFINLQLADEANAPGWGRVVFHVDDPDHVYETAIAAGYEPQMAPSDAPWGERYFHIRDPDGHELSFARPL